MATAERQLIRFFLQHLLVGLLAAALFGGLVLWFDLAGIRSMAAADEDGWLFLTLLFFGLCVTFGSVAMGCGVMGLARDRRP